MCSESQSASEESQYEQGGGGVDGECERAGVGDREVSAIRAPQRGHCPLASL